MNKKILSYVLSYALEITWNDGTKEVRTDYPPTDDIDEYLAALEREENVSN